jgi:hypothetical protein
VECIIKGNVKKVALIPSTHVLQPTSKGDEDDGIWMVWNQQHPNPFSWNMHLAHVNG